MVAEIVLYLSALVIGGQFQGAYVTQSLADCQSAVAEERETVKDQGGVVSDCHMVTIVLPDAVSK